MGRKREWTAKELEKQVNAYFDSITAEQPKQVLVPVMEEDEEGRKVPVKDSKGHNLYEYKTITAKNGKEAVEILWLQPPGIIDLCLFLGIHRSTFFRWCALYETKKEGELTKEEEKLCNIATRARGRIESYLTARSEDRDAQRGVLANLEANFGWKRRKEVGLDEQTRQTVSEVVLTTEEKMAKLAELGLVLPGMEDAEAQEDDED